MTYETDIQLLDGQVKVDAWDLCLDSQFRRRPGNTTRFRRALVHNRQDGLTINYDNDYPDGVKIQGNVTVAASDLCLDSVSRRKNDSSYRRALVHNQDDGLTINYDNDYPDGVKIKGKTCIAGNAIVEGGVEIQGNTDITGALTIHYVTTDRLPPVAGGGILKIRHNYDAGKEIFEMRAAIKTIQDEITALKKSLAATGTVEQNLAVVKQRVREVAYLRWAAGGHQVGHALDDWLAAEQVILKSIP